MIASSLHSSLAAICQEITQGEYDKAKGMFEAAQSQNPGTEDDVLAEALGLMLVRIEAREFELERAIAELTLTREDLLRHKERLAQENNRLRAELRRSAKGMRPVASAPVMLPLMRQAERAAQVDATLLLTGETGTGKGLLARHIHALGPRAAKPFVAINCAAIPASLLESELFGIEAGVASGVQARAGRFEQAAHGTILLDEIGDMPLESQAKLLHVLETGQVERVGGRKPIGVGVRVMAATNRDLSKRVQEGLFRADLFYRLNVMTLHIPPLRERREDIPLLCRIFLPRVAERSSLAATEINREALDMLSAYAWPGNIRELENELERAALMAEGLQITPGDLSPQLRAECRHESRGACCAESCAELGASVSLPGAQAGAQSPSPLAPLSSLSSSPASPPFSLSGLSDAATVSPASTMPPSSGMPAAELSTELPTLAEVEAAHIAAVLRSTGGNKSQAARVLGISREGLRVKLALLPKDI